MISLRKLFGFATNAKAPVIVLGLASNVALTGADEWLKLAPYGESDYWEQQADKSWRKFKQVFSQDQAEQMTSAFNTLAAARGGNFRGLPIYIGHPDANPQRWPDDRRLGGVMGMEAREDGLWVRVAWNDLGRQNCEQGYYIYPSPAWLFPRAIAAQTGKIVPNELKSVGLTNTPNIPDVDAWTNDEPVGGPQPQTENQPMKKSSLPEWLLALLGVKADATDEEIKALLTDKLKSTAANAETAPDVETFFQWLSSKFAKFPDELDDRIKYAISALLEARENEQQLAKIKSEAETLTAANATATAALAQAETATNSAKAEAEKYKAFAIKGTLDLAINSGRITAAEQPGWETRLAANFDTESAALLEKQPALNTQPLDLKPVGDQGDLNTPRGRQIAFNTAIDERMRPVSEGGKGITNFDAAIADIRSTPEGAALLKSMGN